MKGHVLAFVPAINPDDLCRHLLAAYYRARLDAIAPIGDPDPGSWSCPADFLRQTVELFADRVFADAERLGLPGFEGAQDTMARREAVPPACQLHLADVDPEEWAQLVIADPKRARVAQPAGAGRSPADEGQGCPASAPAVGPAPTAPPAVDITTPDSPLSCGPEVKELPVANPLPHDRQSPEETP